MRPEQALVTDEREMLSDSDLGVADASSTLSPMGTLTERDYRNRHLSLVPSQEIKIPVTNQYWPSWKNMIEEELSELRELPDNWDSYGAQVILISSVKNVVHLLDNVVRLDTPKPHVVPTTGGNIQLEWHMLDIDIEIEIDANPEGRFNLFFEDLREGQEQEWEEEDSLNYSKLRECMNLLTSRLG